MSENLTGVRIGWPRSGQPRKPLITLWLSLIALTCYAGGLAGCSPSETTSASAANRAAWGGGLVASIRSEPRTFNRLVARDVASSLVSALTQASLVRIDKVEDRVEPWLAESWTQSEDGLSYEFQLRPNVRFSDGTPLTAEDVLFTFDAVYRVGGPLADSLRVNGKDLTARATDAATVVVTFPEAFSPGIRILDSLPILPKHRLQPALAAGQLAEAWGVSTPPGELVGLGPFVLADYRPGQRLVFARNLYYWRVSSDDEQLPRLDRLTLQIVPDQDTEVLRLEAGEIDFTQSEVRAEDYSALRRAADEGRGQLIDLGVALDADFLFFNLRPDAMGDDPRQSWLQADDFRRAIAHAVDREVFADTVYLGLGEPVHGPITVANHRWYNPDVDVYEYDVATARVRLEAVGLSDRDQDGFLESAQGERARFTLLTQRGNTIRERAAAVIAEDLRQIGITVDVVALEFGALIERVTQMDFDAVYLGFRTSDTDPVANQDLWLSSSSFHFWNPNQKVPATDWEARIDQLMLAQLATPDEAERKRLFDEVQDIFAEYVPALYFAAPRVVIATSRRVANARPALLEPMMLWNADTLGGEPTLWLSSALAR